MILVVCRILADTDTYLQDVYNLLVEIDQQSMNGAFMLNV